MRTTVTTRETMGHRLTAGPTSGAEFDLFHASSGGTTRRQWRVDYVRDPVSAEEEAKVRRYFGGIFPADWDGECDERYPSYGPDWRGSGRRAVQRLGELGVYELAAAQEERARAGKRSR